ncbi:Transcriptional activator hap3 [Babesia sp. Xinjiang]|uniref:Transcriptional activator hap3 n=1 Tax=Babesia sp. Xinjiang TaxID=462227 RepID=UPI000A226757|nr:Transcriptional activator hap3 [Babesia sp. Xinjiang]ORM40376.1 Transcriptional activator hap3 [Babesia sp. Xinjiang]
MKHVPYKRKDARNDQGNAIYYKLVDEKNGNEMTELENCTGDIYATVREVGPPPVTGSGDADSEEKILGVDYLSSNFSGSTSGRYGAADPMLAARSYEELLVSASKPGILFDSDVKPEQQLRALDYHCERSDVTLDSHVKTMQIVNPPELMDSNSGKHGISRHTVMPSAATDSSPYTLDGRMQFYEQGLDIKYQIEHVKGNGSQDDEALRDCMTSSQQSLQPSTDTEPPFSYEPTAYATQTATEYDTLSQSSVSFSAFERRDAESDTSLPIANIGRVMKSVLPGSAKIAKQAKDIVRECVTEFILFVSSEASDICTNERRKTLSAEDILLAMNALGFEHYNEALRSYHTRWRERDQSSVMEH